LGRLNVLLPRLIRLRLLMLRLMLRMAVLRLVLLRLMMLLFAGIELLRFAGRERFAGHRRLIAIPIAITVVVAVIGRLIAARVARLRLEIGLRLAKLFLRRGDQTEIMFSVLIIIFGGNRISRTLRVAGKLEIFFGDVGRRAADFYVLPVGFVNSRQRILVMATTLTVTTAHTLVVVLTVSHDLLFRQPLNLRRMDNRRFASPECLFTKPLRPLPLIASRNSSNRLQADQDRSAPNRPPTSSPQTSRIPSKVAPTGGSPAVSQTSGRARDILIERAEPNIFRDLNLVIPYANPAFASTWPALPTSRSQLFAANFLSQPWRVPLRGVKGNAAP
jgi:hypothetical protein